MLLKNNNTKDNNNNIPNWTEKNIKQLQWAWRAAKKSLPSETVTHSSCIALSFCLPASPWLPFWTYSCKAASFSRKKTITKKDKVWKAHKTKCTYFLFLLFLGVLCNYYFWAEIPEQGSADEMNIEYQIIRRYAAILSTQRVSSTVKELSPAPGTMLHVFQWPFSSVCIHFHDVPYTHPPAGKGRILQLLLSSTGKRGKCRGRNR